MADAATMTISAVILPDEIQKTLSSLTFSYTPADANDKWFYKLVNVTNSSADLIEGSFLSNSAGINTGAANAAVSTSDKVKFIFIKNTATTDGSTGTDESIYICLDGGSVAHSTTDAIEIGSGESWYGKLTNTTVGNLHAISGDSAGSSSGEGSVQCVIAAIIDDV